MRLTKLIEKIIGTTRQKSIPKSRCRDTADKVSNSTARYFMRHCDES